MSYTPPPVYPGTEDVRRIKDKMFSTSSVDPIVVKASLDYAKDYVKKYHAWPALHNSARDGKFHCPSCDAKSQWRKTEVEHENICPYLAFKVFEKLLKDFDKNDDSPRPAGYTFPG